MGQSSFRITAKSRHNKILIVCINKVNLNFVLYQIFVRRLYACLYPTNRVFVVMHNINVLSILWSGGNEREAVR